MEWSTNWRSLMTRTVRLLNYGYFWIRNFGWSEEAKISVKPEECMTSFKIAEPYLTSSEGMAHKTSRETQNIRFFF